ncbi:MAG: hypothetical protein RR523_15280 [Cetobacterium sp.]
MKEIKLLENRPGTVLVDEDGRIYCVCINKSYSKNEAEKLMKEFIQEYNNEYKKDLLNNAEIQEYEFEYQVLDKIELGRLGVDINEDDDIETYEGDFIYNLYKSCEVQTEEIWIGYIK